MHVLVAPDRIATASATASATITTGFTATQVAAAITTGWLRYDSTATVDPVPLSDGGPGLLDALGAAQVGTVRALAHGPVLRTDEGTVFVDTSLVRGTAGDLLRDVLTELAPALVVVGMGGGATTDQADLPDWPASVTLQVAADADPSLPVLGELLVSLGGTRVSGLQVVVDAVGLARRAAAADLVLTAEAIFDGGSLQGRVPRGAAWAAQRAGCPCVVLAERVLVGRREFAAAGVDAAYEMSPGPALDARLQASAERVARTWTSGGR